MMRIGAEHFELLGPCRRCQMVCIDQDTAEQSQEPLLTLAKTRRFDGKIFFGQHACHAGGGGHGRARGARQATIKVGLPRCCHSFDGERRCWPTAWPSAASG